MQTYLEKGLEQHCDMIAYHEAGHAIVGNAHGIEILSISLEPKAFELHGEINLICHTQALGVTFGGDDIAALFRRKNRRRAEVQMTMDVAGCLAETMYCPERRMLDRSEFDISRARALAQRYAPKGRSDGERYLNVLIKRARRILQKRWDQVKRLATALQKRRVLSGDEMRILISKGSGKRAK
ncbi:MAG: hypothetical protein ABMA13_00695 [Chthoniobacteraceae bacterium]